MSSQNQVQIVIVGAGPAGLMAAIQAARLAPELKILLLERGPRPGRKLLLCGGGRCNLSNSSVRAADYAGAESRQVERVLRAFNVCDTLQFFSAAGVSCYEEEAGKYFPCSDRARDVLDALLTEAKQAGVQIRCNACVTDLRPAGEHYVIQCGKDSISAERVILACGGCSLPRTGSDGSAFNLLRDLGQALQEPMLPGLVPFRLPSRHPLTSLAGITQEVELSLVLPDGKVLARSKGALLLTHQGVSGPAVLDISRHVLVSREQKQEAVIQTRWCPLDAAELEDRLRGGKQLSSQLEGLLPQRLLECLLRMAGMDPATKGAQLKREQRKALLRTLCAGELPLRRDLGWSVAKVTAGGVSACRVQNWAAWS